MRHMTMVVNKGILSMRIERILAVEGLGTVELWSDAMLAPPTLDRLMRLTDLLIVDHDHHKSIADMALVWQREHAGQKSAPLLILSDAADRNLNRKVQGLEQTRILTKPFVDAALVEAIRTLAPNFVYRDMPVVEARQPSQTSTTVSEASAVGAGSSETGIQAPSAGTGGALRWSDGLRIGIDEIDEEHYDIITYFEKLYSLMREGQGHDFYQELIGFLESYVSVHFDHEERLQREVGYDGLEAHMLLHAEFRQQAIDIIAQHRYQTVTNADLIQINLFVKNWLREHIMIEDMKIGAFLRRQAELQEKDPQ